MVALGKLRDCTILPKSEIKQVYRLPSNTGGIPWNLFGEWVHEVMGERREIVVAMDWKDTEEPRLSSDSRSTSMN
jgi:hypothetical protein